MSELKPCPLCEAGKPFGTVTQEIGVPSGDSGYRLTIKCRDCGCTITRWALKKAWAISSAETAWNRRAQPNQFRGAGKLISMEEAIAILEASNEALVVKMGELAGCIANIDGSDFDVDAGYDTLAFCQREYDAVRMVVDYVRRAQPDTSLCNHYNGDGGCCADSCHNQTGIGDCAVSGKADHTQPDNEPLTLINALRQTDEYIPLIFTHGSCWRLENIKPYPLKPEPEGGEG